LDITTVFTAIKKNRPTFTLVFNANKK